MTRSVKGLLVVVLLLAATAGWSAVIGPWPASTSYMWDTAPIPGYASGAVSITGTPPADLLLMPAPTGITKTSWLPYGGTYAEKMAIAKLANQTGPAATVHAKIFDPLVSGKSGWAVILKDGDGKILDFGIRGFFAAAQIIPHQYDGAAWTNSPVMTRTRTGNNYYTMDFLQNGDGTIGWTIAAYENGAEWTLNGNTTVAYGGITEIYLSTATPDTSGAANYKWTEFSWAPVPEPTSVLALGAGLIGLTGLVLRRRRT